MRIQEVIANGIRQYVGDETASIRFHNIAGTNLDELARLGRHADELGQYIAEAIDASRIVRTLEELHALPVDSVIRDPEKGVLERGDRGVWHARDGAVWVDKWVTPPVLLVWRPEGQA